MPPLDIIPASTQSDGRWKISYVPAGSNPLSVAILNGSAAKNVTYSFTPDGFPWETAEAMINDPRLTLVQILSRIGKLTETLTLKYVDSTTAGSAAVLFTDYLEGFFVLRRGVDNATTWTVGQKVYVLSFQLGVQRPDAAVENGVDTISQNVAFTDVSKRNVALIA